MDEESISLSEQKGDGPAEGRPFCSVINPVRKIRNINAALPLYRRTTAKSILQGMAIKSPVTQDQCPPSSVTGTIKEPQSMGSAPVNAMSPKRSAGNIGAGYSLPHSHHSETKHSSSSDHRLSHDEDQVARFLRQVQRCYCDATFCRPIFQPVPADKM